MNRPLKPILMGLLATVALIFGETKAHAQFSVTDIPLLAQEITAWVDEITAAGDQLVKLGESVEKAEQMVNKTKEIIEKTKDIYNKIDPYIDAGKKVYDIYRETERIGYDFKMLEQYIATFGQTKLSPSKIRALRMQATRLATELEMIVTDIQAVLNAVTNLTTKDRDDALKEGKENLEKITGEIEGSMYEDVYALVNNELEKDIQLQVQAAFGEIPSSEDEKIFDERLKKIVNEAKKKIVGQDEELYDADAATTVDRAFNLVTAIIGVLAVLMLVWAFGSRVKGEPRHQDALWKVFAGLIFILLLLQVIKVTIFGIHGFDMTLPNF